MQKGQSGAGTWLRDEEAARPGLALAIMDRGREADRDGRRGGRLLSELTPFLVRQVPHQDRFVCGAVFLGVVERKVAARGTFDPDGKGHVSVVLLTGGDIVGARREPSIKQQHRKGARRLDGYRPSGRGRWLQVAFGVPERARLPGAAV
jgi:hypothetical protein